MKRTALGLGFALLATCSSSSWSQSVATHPGYTMSLKGGETVEVSNLYYVINCRSMLTAPPQVTVMSGPAGVMAELQQADVIPRRQLCSKPVKGAKLFLKAGQIDDESTTIMAVRIAYPTKDGPREQTLTIALSLYPSD